MRERVWELGQGCPGVIRRRCRHRYWCWVGTGDGEGKGLGGGVGPGVAVGLGSGGGDGSSETSFEGWLSTPSAVYAVTTKKYALPSTRSETVAVVATPTSNC